MTSEKRIEANRLNATKGGVRTEDGKKISRLNATKHGFFSRVVTDYDKLDHDEFCEEIRHHFEPATEYEAQLVEILLTNVLAYRRISLVERELIQSKLDPKMVEQICPNVGTTIVREGYTPEIAPLVIEDLEKFQRYKTSVVNLIYRTQHELERLQAMRQGRTVASPVAVDVSVN